MPQQIYISNLPSTATAKEIEKLMAPYGKVARVQIQGNGRSMVAYVDMVNDTGANSALSGLANAKMGTNSLNVNEARPRQE